MGNTYKQLVLMDKAGPWKLVEKKIPKPGVGEVLVKMKASTICNQTDLNTILAKHPPHDHQITLMYPHDFRIWDQRVPDELSEYYPRRKYPRNPYPTTMGHEGMGVIEAIGPMPDESPYRTLMDEGLKREQPLKVGDRVAMAATIGGYGEYVITNLDECVRVPDVLTDEEASLFEPCGVVHSVIKQIVRPLDDVLILGQGALGLLATQMAKVYGAKRIITTELSAYKRSLSKMFGADISLDPNEINVVHAFEDITDGLGMPVIIECAGEPETIQPIPYLARTGCRVGQIGACCDPVLIDWSYIHFKGMKITCPMQDSLIGKTLSVGYKETMDLMASGQLDLKNLITHRLSLTVEDTDDIFRKIADGEDVIKAAYILNK